MKKIAFFVEGQTEAVFTQKLLSSIAGTKGLQVEIEDASHHVSFSKITPPNSDTVNYVLIFDCQGDDSVKQKIKENQNSLKNSGYESIIGLRDLFPLGRNDLQPLMDHLPIGLSTDISTKIIISIMEIEAWFIQEYTHFTSLNENLTPEAISNAIGFNPMTDDASSIDHPSTTLNVIYGLAGLSYKKKLHQVRLTTDHIDYNEIYFETRAKRSDLDEYINEIENSL